MKANYLSSIITLLLSLTVVIDGYSQQQIGLDIEGESNGDNSGSAIAFDSSGYRVAIGAYLNQSSYFNGGHARVFEWDGTAWQQLGSSILGDRVSSLTGASVSLSSNGERLAVGSIGRNGMDCRKGRVEIFEWKNSDWVQMGNALLDSTKGYGGFGRSISISGDGNHLIIGAPNSPDYVPGGDIAQVFSWNGTDWVQKGRTLTDGADFILFGLKVSISNDGSRIAVSSYDYVKIFDWNGTDWVQLGTKIGTVSVDRYAIALSGDGNRIVVGDPDQEWDHDRSGSVKVYEWDGSQWIQLGLEIIGEGVNDSFGGAVDMSADGNRIIVGAYQNDRNGHDSGHIRVYQWTGNYWFQLKKDIHGEGLRDKFGLTVAMSANGDKIAAGAPDNDGSAPGAGHVRVYGGFNPLPIALSSFKVVLNGDETSVNWSTSAEISPAIFIVEKSPDGLNWTQIDSLTGNGHGFAKSEYQIWDSQLLSGANHYRLKLVSPDGTLIGYSLVEKINYEKPIRIKSQLYSQQGFFKLPDDANTEGKLIILTIWGELCES